MEGSRGGGMEQPNYGFQVLPWCAAAFLLCGPIAFLFCLLALTDGAGGAGAPGQASASDVPGARLQGQLHAVWSHSVSDGEVHCLRRAGFPMLVIHGRHDILAHPAYGERLAARCAALWRPALTLQLAVSAQPSQDGAAAGWGHRA